MPNPYQNQFFYYKVTPGPKCSSVQFAQLVKFHLECYCSGTDCDMFSDWDGKSLFWHSDLRDYRPDTDKEVWNSLHFYARRFLTQNGITESNLNEYVRFELIRIPSTETEN